HPQYTSSGPIGDSIKLHRANPKNGRANKKYFAILFGGSDNTDLNYNSLVRTRTDLIARGYNPKTEMWCMYPFDGAGRAVDPANKVINWVNDATTKANLANAWKRLIGPLTTLDTQVYYWNAGGHGEQEFRLNEWLKLNGLARLERGTDYPF